MGKTALILCLLLAAGCTTVTPAAVNDPRAIWCENNVPRRDYTEATPRWEVDEINAHNAKGVLWCDWKPDA